MNSNDKNQFDALATLWKGAWDQFNERRKHEFQISLAVWTVLASFTAIMISTDRSNELSSNGIDRIILIIGTVICLILINLIFYRWIAGVSEANNKDKSIALHYEQKLQELSNSKFDIQFEQYLRRKPKGKGIMYEWSHSSQIGITTVLSLTALLALLITT